MSIAMKTLANTKSASKLNTHEKKSDKSQHNVACIIYFDVKSKQDTVLELLLPIFLHAIQFCNDTLQFCGVLWDLLTGR